MYDGDLRIRRVAQLPNGRIARKYEACFYNNITCNDLY